VTIKVDALPDYDFKGTVTLFRLQPDRVFYFTQIMLLGILSKQYKAFACKNKY
jgi:hypothetical protein